MESLHFPILPVLRIRVLEQQWISPSVLFQRLECVQY